MTNEAIQKLAGRAIRAGGRKQSRSRLRKKRYKAMACLIVSLMPLTHTTTCIWDWFKEGE